MSDKVLKTKMDSGLSVALYIDDNFKMFYPLTSCCEASGKGMEGGVGCRSCYEYVGDMFGDCIQPDEGNREEVLMRFVWWSGDETGVGSTEMAEKALDDLLKQAGIL